MINPEDIPEVSWLTSIQFDDIHGGHGKTCSIDQAANVTIQLDIVKVVLGSIHLPRLRLCGVLHVKYSFLSEGSIVIKPQLGISCVHHSLWSLC